MLDGFHTHKKERGVDELLVKLYEPILWRALKVRCRAAGIGLISAQVPNGAVRANAAALMIDAFPLQSPEMSLAESEESGAGWRCLP